MKLFKRWLIASCAVGLVVFLLGFMITTTIITAAAAGKQNELDESDTSESSSATWNGSGTGEFAWPVPGIDTISSGFGWRVLYGQQDFHTGIDIPGSAGTTIVAADDGMVEFTEMNHYSYGNYLIIDHGNGYKTLYAHCISLSVSAGQVVSSGDKIAYVGSTGNSTGPHLHFEIQKNGTAIDPTKLL